MDDRSTDFRLLECLQTLVAERHVTRAADRLGMTQPKLSSALARLRQITGDPLLVRTPEGMVPTAIAMELASHSGEFLRRWKSLVNAGAEFTPETTVRTFKIQTTDFIVQDMLVDAMQALRERAPNVRISISGASQSMMRETLETGEIDLAIGFVPQVPADLYISKLLTYRSCCIASGNHPRISGTLDFDAYLREDHVVLTFGRSHQLLITEQHVEGLIAERNMQRQAAMYVPSVLVVPEIVAHTDLLALVPRPLAERWSNRLKLQVFDPPFPLPTHDVAMIWHARTRNDPASRWFRGILREVVERVHSPHALQLANMKR